MEKRDEYLAYLNYLGKIPSFLYPYLELDIMKRLKDITVLCGMNYASPYAYNFTFAPTRYEHSLGVALITWKLTHDKASTLAALFHDVSTPVFSHVIDYMNKDYKNMESTEEKTNEILNNSSELKELLKSDGIDLEDIINFKKYSVVDLERPMMCADRLDGNIVGGFSWTNTLTIDDAMFIIDSIYLEENELGINEISFKNNYAAKKLKEVNDLINKLTHTKEDKYMMLLLAKIVKRTIKLGIVTYDELYTLKEREYIEKIVMNLDDDIDLHLLWKEFKFIKVFPEDIPSIEIKNKCVNPIVLGKRLY